MAKWRKTMSRGGLGLVALLACSCGSDGGQGWNGNEEWAEPDVSTHRDEIRGGDVITGATGVVDFFLAQNKTVADVASVCTGSMISSNVVMTAAHCLEDLGSKTMSSGPGDFTIRYYDPAAGLRIVYSGAATWSVPSTYNGTGPEGPGGSDDDFAVIQIPTRFAGTDYHDYLRIFSDQGTALQRLDLFGAGIHSYSGSNDNNLRTEDFDVESVADWHIVLDMRDGTGVCKGDSGGPWVYFADAGVSVPLVAAVQSKMEVDGGWPDPENEGGLCVNNDAPHDDAYACRTRGPRIDWVEDQTGLDCELLTGASKDYRRCFELPFVEDVEYEGLERGLAVGIVVSVL